MEKNGFKLPCEQGNYILKRYPDTGNRTLRPWDGGDLLLLDHLTALGLKSGTSVLVINDGFGALSCVLSPLKPDYYNDSFLAHRALGQNLEMNNLEPSSIRMLSLDQFVSESKQYDLVVGKIPKHLSYWNMILKVVRSKIHSDSRMIFGGLTRHISRGVYDACTNIFGSYHVSQAKRKARLIFLTQKDSPPSQKFPLGLDDFSQTEQWNENTLVKLPNTFAGKGIDRGSGLLAECLPECFPKRSGGNRILDLGCGNGFLSLAAAIKYPEAELWGIDESALAVRSAQLTFHKNMPHRKARFTIMDGSNMEFEQPFDLIMCNPPFHEHGVVNRKLALELLLEAKRFLASDGQILVVANTSLGYQGVFGQYFTNVTILRQEWGFSVILLAHFSP